MKHSFRCLFIACGKGCFMHQNVCVLCGANCLRTGLGIAEDSRYPSFLGGERNALPSMILPSSDVTVSPFFRRTFRRNRRCRRNVCVWVSNLRHLVFWTRRLF